MKLFGRGSENPPKKAADLRDTTYEPLPAGASFSPGTEGPLGSPAPTPEVAPVALAQEDVLELTPNMEVKEPAPAAPEAPAQPAEPGVVHASAWAPEGPVFDMPGEGKKFLASLISKFPKAPEPEIDPNWKPGPSVVERAKGGVEKMGSYLSERLNQGKEKLANLLPSLKERFSRKEKDPAVERGEKLAKYMNEVMDQKESKLKALGLGALNLGRRYNKLPFKTKLAVGLACLGIGAVAAGTSFFVPAMLLVATRRAFVGLGTAATIEAFLDKKGVGTTKRYIIAGIAGALAGGGASALYHGGEYLHSLYSGVSVPMGAGLAPDMSHAAHAPSAAPAAPSMAPAAPSGIPTPPEVQVPAPVIDMTPKAPDLSQYAKMPAIESAPDVSGAPSVAEAVGEKVGHAASVEILPNGSIDVHPTARGANQMFLDLKRALREKYYNQEPPQAVKDIMTTHASDLSARFGFLEGGRHAIIYPEEKLEISADGKLLYFDAHGTPETLTGAPVGTEASVPTPSSEIARQLNIEHGHGEVGSAAETVAPDAPQQPMTRLDDWSNQQAGLANGAPRPLMPQMDAAPRTPGVSTLSEFNQAHAPEVAPAAAPAASISPDAFTNTNGITVDPGMVHIYQSAAGEYLYGGDPKFMDASAAAAATNEKVSVFVNHSYTDVLGNRVVQVTEFRPSLTGPATPVMLTDPKFDIDPKAGFTKVLK